MRRFAGKTLTEPPKQRAKANPAESKNFSDEFRSAGRTALYMSYLIDDISRIQGSVSDRLLKPLGITRAQGWILHYVSWRPESTLTEIGRALDITKVAVGKIVEVLVSRGYAVILPDPQDARTKRIGLTREGRKLMKRFGRAGEKLAVSTMRQFDEAQTGVILSFLLAMKDRLVEARDSKPGMLERLIEPEPAAERDAR